MTTLGNFANKCRRAKNVLQDSKLLTRAHTELCLSTQTLFIQAYDDDAVASQAYEEWRRAFRATVQNKHVTDRHESDRVGSTLLPLQLKAYIIVRLAA